MKKKRSILSLTIVCVMIISCQSESKFNNESIENQEYTSPKRQVKLKYFETDVGWGYEVLINDKSYISQKHMPCECGGEGFKTKEKAILAAEFLKKNIENNERNLHINRAQLDSLGAL